MGKNEVTEINTPTPQLTSGDSGIRIETVSFDTPREDVQTLLAKNRLVSVDLQLTQAERENIQRLVVTKNIDEFEYRGSVDDDQMLATFGLYLNTIGENAEDVLESIAHLIARFAIGSARFFDTKLIWIESRSFIPNNYFDTPRWHTDAKFFNPYKPYKSVVAIKGPQTRFGVTLDPKRFAQLSILENEQEHGSEEDIRIRRQLDEITEEAENPKKRNTIIYLAGGDNAVVHSEPRINEQRLFVSVVTSPEKEMSEWYDRMDKKKSKKETEVKL